MCFVIDLFYCFFLQYPFINISNYVKYEILINTFFFFLCLWLFVFYVSCGDNDIYYAIIMPMLYVIVLHKLSIFILFSLFYIHTAIKQAWNANLFWFNSSMTWMWCVHKFIQLWLLFISYCTYYLCREAC